MFKWFFQEYLPQEFGSDKILFTTPSVNTTYLEKCTGFMQIIEYVIKQFVLYVENGKIDLELLDVASEGLIYSMIPSLNKRKYVYGKGNDYETISHLLFSDQSGMTYDADEKVSYKNFFEYVFKRKPALNGFSHCESNIKWLIDKHVLELDDNDCIIFSNIIVIRILEDLYYNGFISYFRFPMKQRQVIDGLAGDKLIEFESSLFSRQEQAYFNYYLNRSQFSNGLNLRNKY